MLLLISCLYSLFDMANVVLDALLTFYLSLIAYVIGHVCTLKTGSQVFDLAWQFLKFLVTQPNVMVVSIVKGFTL